MRSEIKAYEGHNDRIVGGGGCLLLFVLLPSAMSSDRLLLMLVWSKSICGGAHGMMARTLQMKYK